MTYVSPHLQGWGVDLVELVEVAVDDGVLGEAVLGAGGDHDGARHLLSGRSFVVDLQKEFRRSVESYIIPTLDSPTLHTTENWGVGVLSLNM